MSRKRKIKAVIFDMDGLMFDTEKLSALFWKQAGRESGLLVGEEFLACVRGSSREAAEQIFYSCYGADYDYWLIRNRKAELFRDYLDTNEIPVKKGLFELLDFLKKQEYRMILATSTAAHYALQYLERAGVKAYFDGVICGDMVQRCKPDPEIFHMAAISAGCIPEECVVLEDSLNGISAAVAGGFIPVMVPDLSPATEELKQKTAGICADLLEVIGFLEKQETEE